MNVALAIIAGFLVLAGGLALRGRDMNLEQWSVGGRGFGTHRRAAGVPGLS
jgi:Na+/proline symporter